MCMFSSPSIPSVPSVPTPPETPKETDVAVRQARDDQRKQALLMSGRSGDILTGTAGLSGTQAATQAATSVLGV